MADRAGAGRAHPRRERGPSTRILRVLAWPAYRNRQRNPYNAQLYSHLAASGRVEVVECSLRAVMTGDHHILHLHWPDSPLSRPGALRALLGLLTVLAACLLCRLRGAAVVWTAHNLRSHERMHPRLEAAFWRVFTGGLQGCLALSRHTRHQAMRLHPRLRRIPCALTAHGHYRGCYPAVGERQAARRALGMDEEAIIALSLGQIRPYKNLPHLASCFARLPDARLRLVIAGQPIGDGQATLLAACRADARITLDARHIPNQQLALLLCACDLVALPYSDIANSGSALLALSFERPVLLPRLGSIGEIQAMVGDAWVTTYHGELTPQILHAAIARAPALRGAACHGLDALAWEPIAERTYTFLDLISRRRRIADGNHPPAQAGGAGGWAARSAGLNTSSPGRIGPSRRRRTPLAA